MSEHEPSATFHLNLYPMVMLSEFDMNNYRINRIVNQYKYLDEERKTRNNLKKKYIKLSNACLGTEFLISVTELSMVGTSVAVVCQFLLH